MRFFTRKMMSVNFLYFQLEFGGDTFAKKILA